MKNILHVLAIIMMATAIAVLAGCGGGGGGNSSSTGRLSGTVVSATSSDTPIAGATVQMGSYQTTSDNNGQFSFENVPPGLVQISVTCPDGNYKPYAISVVVITGQQADINVPMVPKAVTIGSVAVTAPVPDGPGGSYLTGHKYQFTATVKDASGTPITGATVTWVVDPTIGSIDSKGLFTAIRPGTGTVNAILSDSIKVYSDQKQITVTRTVMDRQVICLARGNRVDVADLTTGEILKTISTYEKFGRQLAVSDGKVYVADNNVHKIFRYDIINSAPGADGYVQPEASYTVTDSSGHVVTITAMTALPDGKLFLGMNYVDYDYIGIYDTSTMQCKFITSGLDNFDEYSDAAYNPLDGRAYVTKSDVTASKSGIVRVDISAANPVAEQFVDGAIHSELASHLSGIAIEPNGTILVCSNVRERTMMYNGIGNSMGDLPLTSISHPRFVRCGPDGNLYVLNASGSGFVYGKVWRFRLPGGQLIGQFRSLDSENVYDMGFDQLVM